MLSLISDMQNEMLTCTRLQVSLMTRIIPSPDWFIGIDSFDLCINGNWLDSITIEVSWFSAE